MPGKILEFGRKASEKMMSGIDELEKAVVTTLGPKGKNVLFDRGTSHPIITKDGVSVAREIKFTDHFKNIGAAIIKEAAENVNSVAGDGTTTTVLLSSELCRKGFNLVNSGKDPVEVQKGMDAACAEIIKKIDDYKLELSSDKDILSIATISANNDESVGKIVHEAFTSIGDGGIVNLQDSHSKTGKTTIEYSDGMEFSTGVEDGRMINDKRSESFELDNANFVLFEFSPTLADCTDILNYCASKGRSCILMAPGDAMHEDLVSMCVNMFITRKLNFVCIKAPGIGEFGQIEELKDIAALIGTETIKEPDDIKDFVTKMKSIEDAKDKGPFGRCEHISSTKFKTVITGGMGTDEAVDARVKEIDEEIEKRKNDPNLGISEEEILYAKKRIAKMTGGIATILVGGLSSTRIKELKDRYEDAIHAVQAAISDGIVPGGGCTLLKAAKDLQNFKTFPNDSYEAGFKLVIDVCREPATLIVKSVSNDYAYIVAEIEHNKSKTFGYDAKKMCTVKDMFQAGIIDPVKVEKTALAYAVSVAGVFITTECVITNELENVSLVPNDEISERTDPNYGFNFNSI